MNGKLQLMLCGQVFMLAATTHGFSAEFATGTAINTNFIYVYSGDGGPLIFSMGADAAMQAASTAATASATPTGSLLSSAAGPDTVFSAFSFAGTSVFTAGGGELALSQARGYGFGAGAGYYAVGGSFDPNGTGNGSAAVSVSAIPPTLSGSGEAGGDGEGRIDLAGDGATATSGAESEGDFTLPYGTGGTSNFPPGSTNPVTWFEQSATSLNGTLTLGQSGQVARSDLDGVAAASLAGRSAQDLNINLNAGGEGAGFLTSGVSAAAVYAQGGAGGISRFTASFSGSGAGIDTTAAGSAGLIAAMDGGSSAIAAIDLKGRQSHIATAGQGAFGLLASTFSAAGNASTNTTLSGRDSFIATQGQDAIGALLIAQGGGETGTSFTLSGANSNLSTMGENAHGLLMSVDGGSASATARLSGTGSQVRTFGDNALGILSVVRGSGNATANLTMSGTNASIGTQGAASTGVFLGSFATGEAGIDASLGRGASITTQGEGAGGLIAHASGSVADMRVVLNGAGAAVRTSGDNAPGIGMIGAGSDDNNLQFTLSGTGAGISTTGDGSPALLVAAARDTGGTRTITLNGRNSYLTTSGANANAANIVGDDFGLSLSRGATIQTTGGQSSAVYLLGDRSRTSISSSAYILALGSGSAGIRYADATLDHQITNRGTISGQMAGILGGAALTVKNSGAIVSAGTGIQTAYGRINNSGLIGGLPAIRFDRQAAGDAYVNNDGLIRSNLLADGDAIVFEGQGDDTLEMHPGALVIGKIALGDGQDTLVVRPGMNLRFTFDSVPENIRAFGRPTIIERDANRVTVIDDSALDPTNKSFWIFSEQMRNAFDRNPRPAAGSATAAAVYGEGDGPPPSQKFSARPASVSLSGFGGWWDDDASETEAEEEIDAGGAALVVGFRSIDDAYLQLGFLWGQSTQTVESQRNEGEVFLGGVRFDKALTHFDLRIDAQYGYGQFDTRRVIANNTLDTGFEIARADFNSHMLSLGASARKTFEIAQGFSFVPELGAGLSYLSGVDYREHGSSVNLDLERDSKLYLDTLLAGSFEHVRRLEQDGIFTLKLRGGLQHRELLSGGDGSFEAIGTEFAFSPNKEETGWTGFVGLRSSFEFENNLSLAAGVDYSQSFAGDSGVSVSAKLLKTF
ncbi:MAG: hypothetical protein ACRECW_11980 [Phyllobacterium sp.]